MDTQNLLERERMTTVWPWRLFVTSLIVLIAAVLYYVGLAFGYKTYLNSGIEKKDVEIAELAALIPKEDQARLMRFYNQIQSLKNFLDQHVVSFKILPLIEKNTNKKIFYNKLDLDVAQRSLNLDRIAESYQILAQQLEAFKQTPGVERFLLNNSQFNQGVVRFNVTVVLKSELFKSK